MARHSITLICLLLCWKIDLILSCSEIHYESTPGEKMPKRLFKGGDWSEILLILKWSSKDLGSPLVFRHDGTVCGLQKKRFGFAESFGPGLAMVPMLGGFLACGGERNIDGKCCFWFINGDDCDIIEGETFSGKVQMANERKFVQLQQKVVIFKESTGELQLGSFDRDLLMIKWSPIIKPTDMAFPISGVCLAMDEDVLYVVGGEVENGNGSYHGTWILENPSQRHETIDDWVFLEHFPSSPRINPGCFHHKFESELHAYGGIMSTKAEESLEFTVNNNCSESVDNVAAWSTSVFLKPIPFKMNNTIAFQLETPIGDEVRTFASGIETSQNYLQVIEVKADEKRKVVYKKKKIYHANSIAAVILQGTNLPECYRAMGIASDTKLPSVPLLFSALILILTTLKA